MFSRFFWQRYRQLGQDRTLGERAAFYTKAAAALFLIREHVAELTVCVGPSMMPTFNPRGDIVIVDHLSVTAHRIKVGDVVIARSVQNPRHMVCKRVLGLEGDVVLVQSSAFLGASKKTKIPQGHVWLQGDNFLNSTDSRHYGPVPYAVLRGRVIIRIWPLWEAGWVECKLPAREPSY